MALYFQFGKSHSCHPCQLYVTTNMVTETLSWHLQNTQATFMALAPENSQSSKPGKALSCQCRVIFMSLSWQPLIKWFQTLSYNFNGTFPTIKNIVTMFPWYSWHLRGRLTSSLFKFCCHIHVFCFFFLTPLFTYVISISSTESVTKLPWKQFKSAMNLRWFS